MFLMILTLSMSSSSRARRLRSGTYQTEYGHNSVAMPMMIVAPPWAVAATVAAPTAFGAEPYAFSGSIRGGYVRVSLRTD